LVEIAAQDEEPHGAGQFGYKASGRGARYFWGLGGAWALKRPAARSRTAGQAPGLGGLEPAVSAAELLTGTKKLERPEATWAKKR